MSFGELLIGLKAWLDKNAIHLEAFDYDHGDRPWPSFLQDSSIKGLMNFLPNLFLKKIPEVDDDHHELGRVCVGGDSL